MTKLRYASDINSSDRAMAESCSESMPIATPVPKAVSKSLQRKLTVNVPGDKYEQEADRVANQVMRMPQPRIQRHCDRGRSGATCDCPECQRKSQPLGTMLQRATIDSAGGHEAPAIVNDVINSPGSPLPDGVRGFMESRFGQDFSHVRVHIGGLAAQSAAMVQASAYTVGTHIVYGGSEHPAKDQYLLAHELAHTIQQSKSSPFGSLSPNQSFIQRKERTTFQPSLSQEESRAPEVELRSDSSMDTITTAQQLENTESSTSTIRVLNLEQQREELFRASLARMKYIRQVNDIPAQIELKFGPVDNLPVGDARQAAEEAILLRRSAIEEARSQSPSFISSMNAAEKTSKGMGDALGYRDVDDALIAKRIRPEAATSKHFSRIVNSAGNPGRGWNVLGRLGTTLSVLTYAMDFFRWKQELETGYMDVPTLGGALRLIFDKDKAYRVMEGQRIVDSTGRKGRVIGGHFVEDPI